MTTIIKEYKHQPEQSTEIPELTYDNYSEIIEKIQKNDTMSSQEMYLLQYNINEILGKEEHIELLKIIIKNTNKKVYTSNKTITLFDLNDLENSILWKLHYYVNFCLENKKKEIQISQLEQENEKNKLAFEKKIQEELKQKHASGEIKSHVTATDVSKKLYTLNDVPTYETLRSQAIYQTPTIHTEKFKTSQMHQLNTKLTTVNQSDEPKVNKAVTFFQPYKAK